MAFVCAHREALTGSEDEEVAAVGLCALPADGDVGFDRVVVVHRVMVMQRELPSTGLNGEVHDGRRPRVPPTDA